MSEKTWEFSKSENISITNWKHGALIQRKSSEQLPLHTQNIHLCKSFGPWFLWRVNLSQEDDSHLQIYLLREFVLCQHLGRKAEKTAELPSLPLGTMNVCAKLHDDPSNICRNVSAWAEAVDRKNRRWRPRSRTAAMARSYDWLRRVVFLFLHWRFWK